MTRKFIDKARANLSAAQLCFENDLMDAAANRAYYAAFQAAVAALAREGIKKDPLDHKWVQAQFSQKLIKRKKIFPRRFRSYLLESQSIRNTADYEADHVTRSDTKGQIQRAREIIDHSMKGFESDQF